MVSKRVAQVLDALSEHLATLTIGDRLTPERQLAQRLGCSRETLRAALLHAEQKGEIWRHVGQGTFYGPRPLGQPMKETIIVQGATPLQLMRARCTIEPSVAGEAAKLATTSEVEYLENLVQRGREARSRSECERVDAAFHRGVAAVTGNPILLGLLDYFAGVRRHAAWQREWEQTYRRLGVCEFTHHHSDHHQEIVKHIQNRDEPGAATAMRRHLDLVSLAMQTRD